MVDTFTPLLRLRKQEVGAKNNLWAPPATGGLNDGVVDLIDQAMAQRTDQNVTSANVNLAKSEGGSDSHRPMFVRAFGTPGTSRNVVVPDPPTQKMYVVQNQSNADIVFKTVSGTGITVTPGQSVLCYVDSVLDDVFGVTFLNTSVLRPSSYTTGTLRISNATAGDTGAITYEWAKQGEFVMFLLRDWSATITPAGAFSQINLNPVNPVVLPVELAPAFQTGIPIDLVVGGSLQRWVFTAQFTGGFILYNEDPINTTVPAGTICATPNPFAFIWSDRGFVS